MLIGSSPPYFALAPSGTPSRPRPGEVSADITRADQAPATPTQDAQGDATTSERKGAGRSPARDDGSPQQQRQEQLEIAELVQRDREVRAHEQAHAAVGGQYAGAPTYSFERGPDGQRYAVSGEVRISTSTVPGDPEATLRKMEIVRRAALAPAEPSAQDLRVAAQAQAQAAQARVELAQLRRDEASAVAEARKAAQQASSEEAEPGTAPRQPAPTAPNLDLYRRLSELPAPSTGIDLMA